MSSICRVSASDSEKQALETRALSLSLNYSFVTPLTSMVVTKPEGQEESRVAEKPVENGGCEVGSQPLWQQGFDPVFCPAPPHPHQDSIPAPHRLPGTPGDSPHFIGEEPEARSPDPGVHYTCVVLGLRARLDISIQIYQIP